MLFIDPATPDLMGAVLAFGTQGVQDGRVCSAASLMPKVTGSSIDPAIDDLTMWLLMRLSLETQYEPAQGLRTHSVEGKVS